MIPVAARPASAGASAGSAARGMKQRVDAIKEALSVAAGLPLPAAIKAANALRGIDGAGPLPEHGRRLDALLSEAEADAAPSLASLRERTYRYT